MKKRTLLKTFSVAFAAVVLTPLRSLAAWPTEAFKAKELDAVATSLYGGTTEASDKITLKAPEIAENGAVVPVSVSADIANVSGISILVDGNPTPLAATFNISEGGVADVSTRIKMGKTSNVIALVNADGKTYQAMKEVKVTIGGCGG